MEDELEPAEIEPGVHADASGAGGSTIREFFEDAMRDENMATAGVLVVDVVYGGPDASGGAMTQRPAQLPTWRLTMTLHPVTFAFRPRWNIARGGTRLPDRELRYLSVVAFRWRLTFELELPSAAHDR